MRWIIGLGNPGPRYDGTRHNIGFAVVDEVARRRRLVFEDVPDLARVARLDGGRGLMKPMTYMNLSGQAAVTLMDEGAAPSDMLLVVDDTALPLGRLRLRASGSSGGHNGLKDVERALQTAEYPRLRLGVGGAAGDLRDYVLDRFTPDENAEAARMVARAADLAEEFIDGAAIGPLMARYNRAGDPPRDDHRGEEFKS